MFYKSLCLDIQNAVLKKGKRYAMALAYFSLSALVFYIQWENMFLEKGMGTCPQPSLGDYFLFSFGGCDQYVFDYQRPFLIPVQWCLFVLLAIYINFDFVYESIDCFHVQLLIRSEGRKKYWFSKVISVGFGIIVYLGLCVLITMLGCSIFGGNLSLEVDSNMVEMMGLTFLNPNEPGNQHFLLVSCMVCFTILTIAYIQLFLSLVCKPMVSFLFTALFLLLSSYFMTPFFIGNYAMVIRNSLFSEGGLSFQKGTVLIPIFCLVAIWGGAVYFDRKDILNERD